MVHSTDRHTVLIIDAQENDRADLRRILVSTYRVLEAENGMEGWQLAFDKAPDLVLADMLVPGIDGFDLCSRLKEDPVTAGIPVILITDARREHTCYACILAGADACVKKPFDEETLWANVGNLIARRYRFLEMDDIKTGRPMEPPERSEDGFVERVRFIVENHLEDPDFSVQQLAEGVALCHSQLYRKLRSIVKVSPSQFIRSIRLEKAQSLLAEGHQSVSEVAFAVGFNSLSYFTQCFRAQFGMAPREFKSQ